MSAAERIKNLFGNGENPLRYKFPNHIVNGKQGEIKIRWERHNESSPLIVDTELEKLVIDHTVPEIRVVAKEKLNTLSEPRHMEVFTDNENLLRYFPKEMVDVLIKANLIKPSPDKITDGYWLRNNERPNTKAHYTSVDGGFDMKYIFLPSKDPEEEVMQIKFGKNGNAYGVILLASNDKGDFIPSISPGITSNVNKFLKERQHIFERLTALGNRKMNEYIGSFEVESLFKRK